MSIKAAIAAVFAEASDGAFGRHDEFDIDTFEGRVVAVASDEVLTKQEVQEYLDKCIRKWRQERDSGKSEQTRSVAIYYVDAFQSVRISLLGELLP